MRLVIALLLLLPTIVRADPPTTPGATLGNLSLHNPTTLSPAQKREGVNALTAILEKFEHDEGIADWPFDVPEIESLLIVLEREQPALTARVAKLFGAETLLRLEENDIPAAERYFGWVMTRRADPNPENDELRLQLALTAKGDRARYFGIGRFEELRRSSRLTFPARIRLLAKGYYGSGYLMLLGAIGSIAIIVTLLYRFHIRIPIPGLPKMPSLPRRKKRVPGYARSTPSAPDEYSRLLSLFGLEDTATEAQIKSAYRQAVKDCHPDSVGGTDPEKVARFQELKQTYDRIMEVRSAVFFGS